MSALNIRDFPEQLLKHAKIRAAYLGKTLRQWVMDLITKALTEDVK